MDSSGVVLSRDVVAKRGARRIQEDGDELRYSDVEAEFGEARRGSSAAWKRKGRRDAGLSEVRSFARAVEDIGGAAAEARIAKKQRGFPAYPENTAFQLDATSLAGEAGGLPSEWVGTALASIMESEMRAARQVYGDAHPKVNERLRDLSRKVLKKLAAPEALKELDLNAAAETQPKPNPKNKELVAERKALSLLQAAYESELKDWQRLESERAQNAELVSKAVAAGEDQDQDPILAAPTASDVSGPEVRDKIRTLIANLQFTNAKLRVIKRQIGDCRSVAGALAERGEAQAFQSYKDVGRPRKLIKALTKPGADRA